MKDNTTIIDRGDSGNGAFTAPLMVSKMSLAGDIFSSRDSFDAVMREARRLRSALDFAGEFQVLSGIEPEDTYLAEYLNEWSRFYVHYPTKGLVKGLGQNLPKESVKTVCINPEGKTSKMKTFQYYVDKAGFSGHILHRIGLDAACTNSDGSLALVSFDQFLMLFDMEIGQCLNTINTGVHGIYADCVSSDGRYVLSHGISRNSIMVWDTGSGKCLRTIRENLVNGLWITPDDRQMLSAGYRLKLWDIASGECVRKFDEIKADNAFCIGSDGRLVISRVPGKTLMLWDLETGKPIRLLEGYTGDLTDVSISADNRYAVSSATDGTIKIWDLASGRCLHTFDWTMDERPQSCFITADGSCLVASGHGNQMAWSLHWELEPKAPADWDDGATPYLVNFLIRHTKYSGRIPSDYEPSEDEIRLALTRKGKPSWTGEDFLKLLNTLGCAGFGWLKLEGIKAKLKELAIKIGRYALENPDKVGDWDYE